MVVHVGYRVVSDHPLTIIKIHRVRFVISINSLPVASNLQNCTVPIVEFKTIKYIIIWVVPDLNLLNLSLGLMDLNAFPLVTRHLGATISAIAQNELIVITANFIHSDKIVVIVESFDGWELFLSTDRLSRP